MALRWNALTERVKSSLFFVPMSGIVLAALLAFAGIALDRRLQESANLPLAFTSTVESARALLSTIASATITFAGIAFSISLLVIQQASNQYSPRIVHTLFRDPFNKRVMALVVGTFTFCLMVLRAVRSPMAPDEEPIVPNLSVAISVLLGVGTVLAIVAFINHSAHSMNISEILEKARAETVTQICKEWSDEPVEPPDQPRADDSVAIATVRFEQSGWVQQVDSKRLLECLPEGATMELRTYPGRYAIAGAAVCLISGPVTVSAPLENRIRRAISLGDTRTMQQDPSYGIRELADVALKALSPGINDPTTAQDAIFHLAAVVLEMLRRNPPPRLITGEADRRLIVPERHTPEDVVSLAFDEIRRAAAPHPTVCIYLLEALSLLDEALSDTPLVDRRLVVRAQARLVVEGCEAAGSLPADIAAVRAAHQKRFTEAAEPY